MINENYISTFQDVNIEILIKNKAICNMYYQKLFKPICDGVTPAFDLLRI